MTKKRPSSRASSSSSELKAPLAALKKVRRRTFYNQKIIKDPLEQLKRKQVTSHRAIKVAGMASLDKEQPNNRRRISNPFDQKPHRPPLIQHGSDLNMTDRRTKSNKASDPAPQLRKEGSITIKMFNNKKPQTESAQEHTESYRC